MVFMVYHLTDVSYQKHTNRGFGNGKEEIGQGAYLKSRHNCPRKTQETNSSECRSFLFYLNPRKENHLSADYLFKGTSPILME